MDTLVEDRHDTGFFFEVFFGFFFLVELGVGTRKGNPHIRELVRYVYFVE